MGAQGIQALTAALSLLSRLIDARLNFEHNTMDVASLGCLASWIVCSHELRRVFVNLSMCALEIDTIHTCLTELRRNEQLRALSLKLDDNNLARTDCGSLASWKAALGSLVDDLMLSCVQSNWWSSNDGLIRRVNREDYQHYQSLDVDI